MEKGGGRFYWRGEKYNEKVYSLGVSAYVAVTADAFLSSCFVCGSYLFVETVCRLLFVF